MGWFLENKVYLSIEDTNLAEREEMYLNFEQGIPYELRETCWLVLVSALHCSVAVCLQPIPCTHTSIMNDA